VSELNSSTADDMDGSPVANADEARSTKGAGREQPRRLRQIFLHGSAWTLLGYGAQQGFRFVGNLILARLLFPEVFGLMALVNIFIQGMKMFSDIGIGPSIIQHQRGEDESFLRTAWTIQIVRGVGIWLCVCLIAWPVARIYGQPLLFLLLPAAGVANLISGVNSMSLFTLNRQMRLGRLTAVRVSSQVVGLLTIVALAWFFRYRLGWHEECAWAMVIGGIVSSVVKVVLSHIWLPGIRHRPAWDAEAARDIVHFGKWILASTALAFLAQQGDRLILGGVLTIAELGIYSIAFFLSQALVMAIRTLARRVLFPVYSQLLRERPADLKARVFKIRVVLLAGALPLCCALAIGGDELVGLLYDDRYRTAGWMLQLLAMGAVADVINTSISPIVLAAGSSRSFTLLSAARLIFLLLCMLVGGYFAGIRGVVTGVAVAPYLLYPLMAVIIRPYRLWMPWLDLGTAAACLTLIFAGWSVFG
jgi:O-antigen/teichoic acid export membrane protein